MDRARNQFSAAADLHLHVALLFFGSISLKYKRTAGLVSDLKSIAKHLHRRRIELGLRQCDAALQIGVNDFTFLTSQKGTSPSDRYWPAILSFLGYDPAPPPGPSANGSLTPGRRATGGGKGPLSILIWTKRP